MSTDSIGDRMKTYYENRYKSVLTRRTPVIVRIDGVHFHTLTRHFTKPFDEVFIRAMQLTTLDLCRNIMGCKIGYVQSDEISLLLTDFDTLQTEAWFDYEVEKICSVSASMAASFFQRNLLIAFKEKYPNEENFVNYPYFQTLENGDIVVSDAYFDARCFNIPESEVTNYFIWRQQDASKNSIQMLARSQFSNKELFKKNGSEIQEMLFLRKGINWDSIPTVQKRGTAIHRVTVGERRAWAIDTEMPILTQDRNYIESNIPRV